MIPILTTKMAKRKKMTSKTVAQVFGSPKVVAFKSKLPDAKYCSNPELLLGVELETENVRNSAGGYSDILSSGFNATQDNSLRGSALEFISVPMRQATLLPELEAFFKITKFSNRNYSDRCSVHVHANVQDFTQEQLSTLFLAYTVVEDVMFQFVNTGLPEGVGERDTNLYCVPWSQCRMNRTLLSTLLQLGHKAAFKNWQKYTALNLVPITTYGTVEFRHMHGTSDMGKLTTWINLIGSLMRFSKESTYDEIVATLKILNDVSAYERFYTAVLGNYLPYNETFRQKLFDGVLNAKYSLWYVPEKGQEMKQVPEVAVNPEARHMTTREILEQVERLQAAREADRFREEVQRGMLGTADTIRPLAAERVQFEDTIWINPNRNPFTHRPQRIVDADNQLAVNLADQLRAERGPAPAAMDPVRVTPVRRVRNNTGE